MMYILDAVGLGQKEAESKLVGGRAMWTKPQAQATMKNRRAIDGFELRWRAQAGKGGSGVNGVHVANQK